MGTSGDITQALHQVSRHEPGSFERLFALLYEDLHLLAVSRMKNENSGHTLQATALVHEAYVRMVDQTRCQWQDRAHFLAVASQIMRRALVDHARTRERLKRGAGWDRVPFEEALTIGSPHSDPALLALDDALRRLEQNHPDKARLVEMRFFGGLTHEECAEVLSLSSRTVARHLDFAQSWLYRDMTSAPSSE
jgi:RNA polymerase sigma-70 factor (ECF subfamily)